MVRPMASLRQGRRACGVRDVVLCCRLARPDHDRLMKKVLTAVAALAGLGVLARLLGPKVGNIDWEKRFEALPDNAPPKWMFRNITAIRENTDRILEILESRSAEPARPAPRPVPPDH